MRRPSKRPAESVFMGWNSQRRWRKMIKAREAGDQRRRSSGAILCAMNQASSRSSARGGAQLQTIGIGDEPSEEGGGGSAEVPTATMTTASKRFVSNRRLRYGGNSS